MPSYRGGIVSSLARVSDVKEEPSLVTEVAVTMDSVSELQVEGQVLGVLANPGDAVIDDGLAGI